MAFVIGLVAAATRALSSDDGSNPGYNNNGQNNNNSNRRYNIGRAASAVGRRADRRTDRIASRAADAATVMSLMSSGSRSGSGSRSAAPAPRQPEPYMDYGEGPVPRDAPYMNHGNGSAQRGGVAYTSYYGEAQRPMAGSYRDRVPAGAPEGCRWRKEQSYNRPVSHGDEGRDLGRSLRASSSVHDLPSYEQAAQRPRKS